MLVRLDGNNFFEEINETTKPLLGEGEQGGKVFQYNDRDCLKILKPSNTITEINIDYFIEKVTSFLLLSPKRKGYDINNRLVAYTTPYIANGDSTISEMSTKCFLERLQELKEAIHTDLSRNKIAIFDGNNYIIGNDGRIYLCDFDMYKTPFSPQHLLYRIKNDYFAYNDTAFNELVFSILENETLNEGNNRQNPSVRSQLRCIERKENDAIEYVKKINKQYKRIKDYTVNFKS